MTKKVEQIIQVTGITVGICGAIFSTIYGLILMDASALVGFITIIIGLSASLLAFCFIYGFGVILEKVKEIANNTKKGIKVELEYPNEKN